MSDAAGPELAWSRKLAETVDARFMGGWLLPAHVFNRIATLVGHEELRYVDSSVADAEPAHATGQLVVWTVSHLIIADLRYVSLHEPSRSPMGQNLDGDVALQVLPRSALREIAIPPHLDGNYAWQQSADTWGRGVKVHLTYEGLDGPLTVPSGEPRPNFAAFVRELLKDQLS